MPSPRLEAHEVAPMLCAGAIGYRSLRLSGLSDGQDLGLTGFGASAHLVLPMVRRRFPSSRVFVFARSERQRAFALELGASWAGATEEEAPAGLHAVIDTTPAWTPVVAALRNLLPGGRLVINAIGKQEADKAALLQLDYPRDLWREKEILSVANVTRQGRAGVPGPGQRAGDPPRGAGIPSAGGQRGFAGAARRPWARRQGAAGQGLRFLPAGRVVRPRNPATQQPQSFSSSR
jgi:hypothetical protein